MMDWYWFIGFIVVSVALTVMMYSHNNLLDARRRAERERNVMRDGLDSYFAALHYKEFGLGPEGKPIPGWLTAHSVRYEIERIIKAARAACEEDGE